MARTLKVEGLEWLLGEAEPIQGEASTEFRDWETWALSNRSRFAASLRSMGLPKPIIAEALGVRDSAARDVEEAIGAFWESHPYRYIETPPAIEQQATYVYDSAHRSAWGRLRDWWSGRAIEVAERSTVELRVPLFTLSAPAAIGSSTEFTMTSSHQSGVAWSMSIAGSGLGDEGKVQISTSATFHATEGQAKVVFLPLTAVVESILIRGRGAAELRTHRVDISSLRDQHPAPGLLLLAPTARPPLGPLEQTYFLSGDESGEPATYKDEYQRGLSATTKLGIKLRGIDLGVRAETTLETSASLSFVLPSGRDYRRFGCLEGHGVLWG